MQSCIFILEQCSVQSFNNPNDFTCESLVVRRSANWTSSSVACVPFSPNLEGAAFQRSTVMSSHGTKITRTMRRCLSPSSGGGRFSGSNTSPTVADFTHVRPAHAHAKHPTVKHYKLICSKYTLKIIKRVERLIKHAAVTG